MAAVKCGQCGANIDPLATACPFCKLTTPVGVAEHQRAQHESRTRAQWEAHTTAAQNAAWKAQVSSASTQSLAFSLAGMVLCCLPSGIAAIVQGLRARAMAKKHGVPVPATATIGLVIGAVSLVTSIAAIVYLNREIEEDKARTKQRITALEQQIGAKAATPALDHATACGLAEKYALENGWDKTSGHQLQQFSCVGKLTAEAESARLDNVRFANGSTKHDVAVCFRRGQVWYVTEITKATSCLPVP